MRQPMIFSTPTAPAAALVTTRRRRGSVENRDEKIPAQHLRALAAGERLQLSRPSMAGSLSW